MEDDGTMKIRKIYDQGTDKKRKPGSAEEIFEALGGK